MKHGAFFAVFAALFLAFWPASCAFAERKPFICTPAGVCEGVNKSLSNMAAAGQAELIDRVEHDEAGGFLFSAADGRHMLHMGDAYVAINGKAGEDGRIDEFAVAMQPSGEFGRGFAQQSDWISRVCVASLFGALDEDDRQFLMDSYVYDIRAYHYTEGDTAVAQRVRMCEIEMCGEVVRIDSEAGENNTIRLDVTFLHDADEATRRRARENGWRIRILSRAVSDCEMIQTCGECLDGSIDGERQEDIGALLVLIGENAQGICDIERENLHSQEDFFDRLQEKCAFLLQWIGEYNLAVQNGDDAAAQMRLADICRLCEEIGRMPEQLY